MKRLVQSRLKLSALAVFVCVHSGAAFAQQPGKQLCLEGKTASGQCVNPGLAASMRQDAIIFAQPKISYTAFPVLPSDDMQYRYPNSLIPDPLLRSRIGLAGGGGGGGCGGC